MLCFLVLVLWLTSFQFQEQPLLIASARVPQDTAQLSASSISGILVQSKCIISQVTEKRAWSSTSCFDLCQGDICCLKSSPGRCSVFCYLRYGHNCSIFPCLYWRPQYLLYSQITQEGLLQVRLALQGLIAMSFLLEESWTSDLTSVVDCFCC